MKPNKLKLHFKKQWLALAALAASACVASAQSSDAIIDKLVEKGILTVKEANELREEADKGFTSAYSVKSGMPDWVSSLKFNGDIRARYESFFADDSFVSGGTTNKFLARNRFRYRMRFGATVSMFDNLEAGLKLTSSDAASGGANNEGDPISGNTTMQNNGSKKLIYIDQAYGRWYALNGPDWTGVLTVGKMENPLMFDDMVFDPDYTPEGIGLQLGYTLNDKHTLKFNAGGFILDEAAASSNDPYLIAAQARWDAKWNTKWSSALGLAALSVESPGALANGSVPNINRGNTRDADGTPTYAFNPWVVDGSVTYTAESFPLYKGAFPIKLSGEYMNNPGAPSSADNNAWNIGVMFGKSGKKGTWDFTYTYKWLGANAWYEELVDSDFGAFYAAANSPANSGSGIGYASGTNVKGHILRLQYSPTDSVTLAAKLFMTDLINAFPANGDSQMNRLQVDANWKF
ncbi:MAG: hypothetical protein QOD03_236 [Verrucomicrobiota bacterium]|jgi:hypothetical protein